MSLSEHLGHYLFVEVRSHEGRAVLVCGTCGIDLLSEPYTLGSPTVTVRSHRADREPDPVGAWRDWGTLTPEDGE